MSVELIMAACAGACVTLLLTRHETLAVIMIAFIAALAVLYTSYLTPPTQTYVKTTENKPFEMDVVQQQPVNEWEEWETKYNNSAHIEKWLSIFEGGNMDCFEGFIEVN